jgi:hypothetical protein
MVAAMGHNVNRHSNNRSLADKNNHGKLNVVMMAIANRVVETVAVVTAEEEEEDFKFRMLP